MVFTTLKRNLTSDLHCRVRSGNPERARELASLHHVGRILAESVPSGDDGFYLE